MSDLQAPQGYRGVVRTGGVGLGEGRVKFPLYTWKPGKAATQPLSCLLPLQARALYIVLMLFFSCLADGHTAAARITLPQIRQILWLRIKSGVQRETESVLGKRLGCGDTRLFHHFLRSDHSNWIFMRECHYVSILDMKPSHCQCVLWVYLFRTMLALSSVLLFLPLLHSAQMTGWHPVYVVF